MKNFKIFIFLIILLNSCSSKKQIVYIQDSKEFKQSDYSLFFYEDNIETGDILKIDVISLVPEADIPYNNIKTNSPSVSQNLQLLQLEGYLVDNLGNINFPVLGKINTKNMSLNQLENQITKLLLDGNHLNNPTVKIRRINSKFTVLGEVRNPGTFSYFDEKITLFQALGYAGDLTIDGKRNDITLIREENGKRSTLKIHLTKSDLLNKRTYQIKNNDIIIVNPSFSKIKSAGFIGSPASIASIASLLLSITLLIINN